jgi:hypothetical protein
MRGAASRKPRLKSCAIAASAAGLVSSQKAWKCNSDCLNPTDFQRPFRCYPDQPRNRRSLAIN